ncbi:hypothetical protein V1477_021107 [Vespula maculifrons]|uniref:Uncharacterized protein n=1 Tax=Vespula maculifrons TaxID=7453 RepID=A0ABD2AJV1_VESMC
MLPSYFPFWLLSIAPRTWYRRSYYGNCCVARINPLIRFDRDLMEIDVPNTCSYPYREYIIYIVYKDKGDSSKGNDLSYLQEALKKFRKTLTILDSTIPPTDNIRYRHFKKLDEIRDQLVISDIFVPRLLKSSIQMDGCYRDSLAMATCSFHTPDD